MVKSDFNLGHLNQLPQKLQDICVYWLKTYHGNKYISVVDGKVCQTTSSDLSTRVKVIMNSNLDYVLLTSENRYLSVQPDGSLQANRKHIGLWEKFKPVYFSQDILALLTHKNEYLSAELDRNFVANQSDIGLGEKFNLEEVPDELLAEVYSNLSCLYFFGDFQSEAKRFKNKVLSLQAEKKPVKIYVGPGKVPIAGFLNIDLVVNYRVNSNFIKNNFDEIFQFPANSWWQIPDSSVDYIFHEDFIEHIDQLSQVQFLAEAYRVLKASAVHRISTPCLIESMRLHSDFEKGFQGVFSNEWKQWNHINLLTKRIIEEMATMIGYKRVHFTVKNHSLSKYHPGDSRPNSDRDENFGNVYVELLKDNC